MPNSTARKLALLCAAAAFTALSACGHKEPAASAPPMSENQRIALARAAQGAGYLIKEPERSVEYYKQALQVEPGNREYQENLAYALHRAGRTEEAITLWKSLAEGTDKPAQIAKAWLGKVGVKPKE